MDGTVETILNLMKATFNGGEIKTFLNGDPDMIANFNLPAIVVSKQNDVTQLDATGFDRATDQLQIKVILDQKADWDAKKNKDLTEKRIRDLVELRDPTTGEYEPATVKGALRRNMTIGPFRLSGDVRFELGTVFRPNDTITAEGHIFITIYTRIVVQNRS